MVRMFQMFTALMGLALLCNAALAQTTNVGPERWVNLPSNLLSNANIPKPEAVLRRAPASVYTHVNLSDTKFCNPAAMPKNYFANVARVRARAEELKLEIIGRALV